MNWGLLLSMLPLAALLWFATTHAGRQCGSMARVGLATLPQRLGSSAVVVVGIAGVVGVLVAVLAIAAGFERTFAQTGSDDTVIVLSAGAQSESSSSLDGETVSLLSQLPQVLKNGEGKPVASAEQVVVATLPKRSSGLDVGVTLRGVGEQVWTLWPDVKIVAGRPFQPGLAEVVIGKGAREEFAGLDVGSTVKFENQPWTVVGVFDSGDAHDSEIWGDTQVVGSSHRRGGGVTSLSLRLTDARVVEAFKAAVQSDPRLKVDVHTTRQFYNRQAEKFVRMMRIVGGAIGVIMALGAIFGALNATYSSIADRVREIATVRAIGFRSFPVIVSVLLETMLLATVGGLIGGGAAWAIFDGFTGSTGGFGGQVVFAFAVSPQLLWEGLKWALAIGFIGGLLPAIRAARLPIVMGLRAL